MMPSCYVMPSQSRRPYHMDPVAHRRRRQRNELCAALIAGLVVAVALGLAFWWLPGR